MKQPLQPWVFDCFFKSILHHFTDDGSSNPYFSMMDMMVLQFLLIKKVACFPVHLFVMFDRFTMIITLFFPIKKVCFKNMI